MLYLECNIFWYVCIHGCHNYDIILCCKSNVEPTVVALSCQRGLVYKDWGGGWGWVIFKVSVAYMASVLITGELRERRLKVSFHKWGCRYRGETVRAVGVVISVWSPLICMWCLRVWYVLCKWRTVPWTTSLSTGNIHSFSSSQSNSRLNEWLFHPSRRLLFEPSKDFNVFIHLFHFLVLSDLTVYRDQKLKSNYFCGDMHARAPCERCLCQTNLKSFIFIIAFIL